MHVCLFDIDGTLLNSGGAGQAAMEEAMRIEFGASRLCEGLETAGRTDRAITLDLFQFHGLEFTEDLLARFHQAYLRQLPAELARKEGLILPGVVALLEALRTRNDVALGLLTGNYREGARLKLGHFDLHHHFAFGGYGDRHLHRDDVAREALEEVQRRVDGDFNHDRLWVIGDTPADVRCGRAIGARVAAVSTGRYSSAELSDCAPDLLLADFSDPGPLLDSLR